MYPSRTLIVFWFCFRWDVRRGEKSKFGLIRLWWKWKCGHFVSMPKRLAPETRVKILARVCVFRNGVTASARAAIGVKTPAKSFILERSLSFRGLNATSPLRMSKYLSAKNSTIRSFDSFKWKGTLCGSLYILGSDPCSSYLMLREARKRQV